MCRPDVDPAIVERLICSNVADHFIDNFEDFWIMSIGTMSSFPHTFDDTDALFL